MNGLKISILVEIFEGNLQGEYGYTILMKEITLIEGQNFGGFFKWENFYSARYIIS